MALEKVRGALGRIFSLEPHTERRKWDGQFRQWIKSAISRGLDPNDVGDEAWANDHLSEILEDLYLKYIPEDGIVLELGPGSGRLTRHLIGRAQRIELVDNSKFVIEWMKNYLDGKARFRTHLVDRPACPAITDASVDLVVAHGVIEHLDFDETYSFLIEFHRVLKPGGYVSYNYDTLHSSGGVEWFRLKHRGPGIRCTFRFYTPDFMARIAEVAGFEIARSVTSNDRLAHIVLNKSRP